MQIGRFGSSNSSFDLLNTIWESMRRTFPQHVAFCGAQAHTQQAAIIVYRRPFVYLLGKARKDPTNVVVLY